MKVWIDIENAPQVQYISPFVGAVRAKGHDVVVTARDQDVAIALLRKRGIEPIVVGSSSGTRKVQKLVRLATRALRLGARFARRRPDVLIGSSRSSDLVAWCLRIPNFQFTDYEFADDRVSRLTGAHLVYPEAIDKQAFLAKGLREDRLMPFPGIKESISFAEVDLAAIVPHRFPELEGRDLAKVLFRAPGEATHYFVDDSLTLALEVLTHLASRDDVVVIYTPRYPSQIAYLDRFSWRNDPIVLREGIPFVPLLKGVDAVISAGGTMLREAAFLGIPAYSILRSEIGQVDRHLEALGRLTILETVGDLPERFEAQRREPLATDPDLPSRLVDAILERARSHR